MPIHQQLNQEIDRLTDELILAVQACIQINSVKKMAEAGPGAPFGSGIRQCLEWTLALGESMGFTVKNIDGYAGHIEMGSGELFGILGHLDVVPEGDGWSIPPFSGKIIADKIYGRGAIDDKGPTLAALFAMKAIQNCQLPLNKKVRLILGTDEESGWADMDYYRSKEEIPTFGFAPDAEFPVINGEKGILHIEISKSLSELPHLVAIIGGKRPNVVPDLCQVTLRGLVREEIEGILGGFLFPEGVSASLLDEGNPKDELTVMVKGISAHGSLPQKGENAVIHALRFLQSLPLHHDEEALITWLLDHPGNGYHGEGLSIPLVDEVSGKLSLNLGILELKRDVLRVTLDIRYPVTGNQEQLLDALQKETGSFGFQFKVINHHEPHYVDENSPLVQGLLQAYGDVTGKEAYAFAIGGGTYAKVLPQGVAFGALSPGEPEVMHAPDEYITASTLNTAAKVYAHAILNLALASE